MKKDVCLDANIIVACLSPDENDEWQDIILKKIDQFVSFIWGPALLNFELSVVLNRKVLYRNISSEDAADALNLFFKLPIVMVWNQELLHEAMKIQRQGIKEYYDSTYLALAKLKNLPLITNDRKFLQKGKKIYSSIFSLQQWCS